MQQVETKVDTGLWCDICACLVSCWIGL